MKARFITITAAAITLAATMLTNAADDKKPAPKSEKPAVSTIVKSAEEWKKILSPEEYRVTRTAGTERAYSDNYEKFKKQGEGTYYCVCCAAELFDSSTKFDSRCGWPSFYDESKAKNIKTKTDYKIGYARTEVVCGKCDAHLGHVFTGEGFGTPTDKRYCINAVALKFVEKGGTPPLPAGTAKKPAK